MLPYVMFSQYGKTAMVREEWALPLADALLDGKDCEPTAMGGRGQIRQFPFERSGGLVRTYYRGGLVRHFLKDAFLFTNRPLWELQVLTYLYEEGFAVPEPLGVCWERRGVTFRGALATRRIKGIDLLDYLSENPDGAQFSMERAGVLIREMHDLGVYHADLQIRNILFAPEHLYLIDFDNAIRRKRIPRIARARNLLRLRRSIEKHYLPDEHFEALLKGYGMKSLPKWLDMLYALRSSKSTGSGRRNP
jgi:3-deoxy-D-manno-octulosonic acid kinase